jgi:hypothetical protein
MNQILRCVAKKPQKTTIVCMVTIVSEQYYNSLQNKPDLHDIIEIQLDVYGTNKW